MQPDLQGLEISKGELKHLTGVEADEIFRPASIATAQKRVTFLLQEFLIGVSLTPLAVGFLYIFIIVPILKGSVAAAIACLILTPIVIILLRWYWRSRNSPQTLIALLEEIDRYHAVLKAIDISDQIEAAGSAEATLRDRNTVIEALQLTRSDLIRALRAERILRENKDFIATNPELFANNLTAIRALQIGNQASEYGQFLDRALQIGIGVQAEMRKLQSQHSSET